jgi:predicted nucleic acid-binding protein
LECTNVLWKHVRFRNLATADARTLTNDLRDLKLRRTPMKKLLDASLEIALRNELAVYDASYIAVAEHYDFPLVSVDQPQIRAANGEGILIEPLTNFHP